MCIEGEDDRILMKDHLFLVYGKVIRKQVRGEKKARKGKPKQAQKQISAPRVKKREELGRKHSSRNNVIQSESEKYSSRLGGAFSDLTI